MGLWGKEKPQSETRIYCPTCGNAGGFRIRDLTHVVYRDGVRHEEDMGSVRACTKCNAAYCETLGTVYLLGEAKHFNRKVETPDGVVPGKREDGATPSRQHDPDLAWGR